MQMINQIIGQEAENQTKLWNDYMKRIQEQQDRELMELGLNQMSINAVQVTQSSLPRSESYHLPFVVITKEKADDETATKSSDISKVEDIKATNTDNEDEKFKYFEEWFNQLTKQAQEILDKRQNPNKNLAANSSIKSAKTPIEPERERKTSVKVEDSNEKQVEEESTELPKTDGKLAYFEKWLIELSEQLSKQKAEERAIAQELDSKPIENENTDKALENTPSKTIEL